MAESVELAGLGAQRRRLGPRIERALVAVVDRGEFILGPEVARLEEELAGFCGVKHVVGCSSGTDALLLGLLVREVGPGDAVLVPAFTFASTAEVVALIGATPVFVDVRADTFDLDPVSLGAAVDWATGAGLHPVGVIPVDLFGHPADYGAIGAIAAERGLFVLADAAQSLGATLNGRPVGSLADVTATSFFPAKPLGCYGDGGAVLTDDDDTADTLRSLRAHGRGAEKHDSVRIGINGRLDTLQAAVLLVKLEIFTDELARRHDVAARYHEGLDGVAELPAVRPGATSAWAQYTLRVHRRDELVSELRRVGIPTAVYYRRPLHRQGAFQRFPVAPGGLPVSERLAGEVVSLPMHPYLGPAAQDRVVAAVRAACGSER